MPHQAGADQEHADAALDTLRAEFEAACAALAVRPNLDRREGGEYRVSWTRALWLGWQMAVECYCEGEV